MTVRQRLVAGKVIARWRRLQHYRAEGSGERVTLASLHRAGVLTRRVWRSGSAPAHEYRPSADLLTELGRTRDGSSTADLMPVRAASADVLGRPVPPAAPRRSSKERP